MFVIFSNSDRMYQKNISYFLYFMILINRKVYEKYYNLS